MSWINRRGFVLLGAIVGVVSPFVAKASTLMRLRGPSLYTGPTIKIALIDSHEDGRAKEAYTTQRIVELPFNGNAAFGGRLTVAGVTGLVAGFGGSWPDPIPDSQIPAPWEQHEEGEHSPYSPEQLRKMAESILRAGGKAEGESTMYFAEEDGNLARYRMVREDIG